MEDSYRTAYNLGSGRARWSGWINVDDTVDADLRADIRKLPIESDSADAVAAIHVLEHFPVYEVVDVLTEWKRILKPGGKLILELPCLDKVFGYVVRCIQNNEDMAEFMTLHALYGNPTKDTPKMGHCYGWFTKPLMEVLENKVGMRDVQAEPPRYHFHFRDMRVTAIK